MKKRLEQPHLPPVRVRPLSIVSAYICYRILIGAWSILLSQVIYERYIVT